MRTATVLSILIASALLSACLPDSDVDPPETFGHELVSAEGRAPAREPGLAGAGGRRATGGEAGDELP